MVEHLPSKLETLSSSTGLHIHTHTQYIYIFLKVTVKFIRKGIHFQQSKSKLSLECEQ
jgi:hypothetical protein